MDGGGEREGSLLLDGEDAGSGRDDRSAFGGGEEAGDFETFAVAGREFALSGKGGLLVSGASQRDETLVHLEGGELGGDGGGLEDVGVVEGVEEVGALFVVVIEAAGDDLGMFNGIGRHYFFLTTG